MSHYAIRQETPQSRDSYEMMDSLYSQKGKKIIRVDLDGKTYVIQNKNNEVMGN